MQSKCVLLEQTKDTTGADETTYSVSVNLKKR